MISKVIVALDFETKQECLEFINLFDYPIWVKVGMEAVYGQGLDIINEIKQKGHYIFLDLKLHDIPNTVKRAMVQLAKLDVNIVNVHASGGIEMMKAAIEGLEQGKVGDERPLCIAVTQLTSTNQAMLENQLLINQSLESVVTTYAKNARMAGMDGVVCSPLEAKAIHENVAKDFLCVTPGIRLKDGSSDDQKRIATPDNAFESDYIVVGRPITRSENPKASYEYIVELFNKSRK